MGGKFRTEDSALRGRILSYMAGAEAEVELLGTCAGGDGEDRREIASCWFRSCPTPSHEPCLGKPVAGVGIEPYFGHRI